MSTPIVETFRKKILEDAAGGIGVWKADDAAETHIIITRVPSIDPDDNSVFSVDKNGNSVYLGTTKLGKDGVAGVTVMNDGTIILWVPEAAVLGDPGSSADLYMVKLSVKVPAEAPATITTNIDQPVRDRVTLIEKKLAQVKAVL